MRESLRLERKIRNVRYARGPAGSLANTEALPTQRLCQHRGFANTEAANTEAANTCSTLAPWNAVLLAWMMGSLEDGQSG